MAGKAKTPAPIDRPLSRAYLREFAGLSTAFPPGVSEPNSLRVMENTMVNRDGSLRIRPGLRYLSYEGGQALTPGRDIVGTHEVFFLADGTKAYLFAVREANGTVGFRAAKYVGGAEPFAVYTLTNPAIGFTVPGNLPFSSATTYVKYLQIDNKIIALSDSGEPMRIFYVGATKTAKVPAAITRPAWDAADKAIVRQPNQASVNNPTANPPYTNNTNASRVAGALLGPPADQSDYAYSIGYFYTFSNEVGESAPVQMTVVKVKRRWQGWLWETPAADMTPSGTETDDPAKVCDQLAIYPDGPAFDAAQAAGATGFHVYAAMWSDQDPVPVEGTLIGSVDITPGLAFNDCWVRHSPVAPDGSKSLPIPTESGRRNYSDPSHASQGIVASDRLVLVGDPDDAAVIRWTSNQFGEYTNFSSSAGGGYKTLTSGNLYVPVCVKLWQNPESKDTLTVLCMGVDGESTAYYMAPAQVSSQSDTTQIMAFEETTATPGTSSPFGCEVLNNALYHPLETELMKSTASNYNINHKAQTEQIANLWQRLADKDQIVSSQLDNRLYYIVHNPAGAALEAGCWGNEVWVLDTASKNGTWSRWLVQAKSLRKIEVDGRVVMSVVRPDGLYCFDDTTARDEYVDVATRQVLSRPIPWRIETNTQGANRAHDAWAHLQQASIVLGNFSGQMRWGVRGYDLHGRAVDAHKITRDDNPTPTDDLPWDLEDSLRVARDMKEWRFYAESVTDGAGLAYPSTGQISLVQYRYTPVSVNVGYEYGSVETFEYNRNVVAGNDSLTVNGVPTPMADTTRP